MNSRLDCCSPIQMNKLFCVEIEMSDNLISLSNKCHDLDSAISKKMMHLFKKKESWKDDASFGFLWKCEMWEIWTKSPKRCIIFSKNLREKSPKRWCIFLGCAVVPYKPLQTIGLSWGNPTVSKSASVFRNGNQSERKSSKLE